MFMPMELIHALTSANLSERSPFAADSGRIREDVSVVSLGFARPPAGEEEGVHQAQNREFREAELEDSRRTEKRSSAAPPDGAEVEADAEGERDRIERGFAELRALAPTDPEVVVCTFKIRDHTEKVVMFPRSEIRNARYFRAVVHLAARVSAQGRVPDGGGVRWRNCNRSPVPRGERLELQHGAPEGARVGRHQPRERATGTLSGLTASSASSSEMRCEFRRRGCAGPMARWRRNVVDDDENAVVSALWWRCGIVLGKVAIVERDRALGEIQGGWRRAVGIGVHFDVAIRPAEASREGAHGCPGKMGRM
jgi:hypothetical protein